MIDKELKGEAFLLISALLYAITAVLIKDYAGVLSSEITSLSRFVLGIIVGVILIKITRQDFYISNLKLWILRGILGALSMWIWFEAIQITSSGRATLLFNTYPIFIAIWGWLFFKEKITFGNILSLLLCITGVMFVFYDGSSYTLYGDVLALFGGILASINVMLLKGLVKKTNPMMIYLSPCFFGLVLLAFTFEEAGSLSFDLFMILAAIGVVVSLGNIIMNYGYKFISIVKGSIVSYSEIIFAIILSYIFINEEFKFKFFIGIALIGLGLLINNKLIYSKIVRIKNNF